jgi:hypothetical protein
MQYWTSDVLDVQIVANGRAQRHMRSNLTNPEYSLSDVGYLFSTGENSAILSILGDKVTQTCPKKFADYLFGKLKTVSPPQGGQSRSVFVKLRAKLERQKADMSLCVRLVNERLPYEVGWKKPALPITLDDLVRTLKYVFPRLSSISPVWQVLALHILEIVY